MPLSTRVHRSHWAPRHITIIYSSVLNGKCNKPRHNVNDSSLHIAIAPEVRSLGSNTSLLQCQAHSAHLVEAAHNVVILCCILDFHLVCTIISMQLQSFDWFRSSKTTQMSCFAWSFGERDIGPSLTIRVMTSYRTSAAAYRCASVSFIETLCNSGTDHGSKLGVRVVSGSYFNDVGSGEIDAFQSTNDRPDLTSASTKVSSCKYSVR